MQAARDFLLNTTPKIKNISIACEYQNQEHFIRTLKNIMEQHQLTTGISIDMYKEQVLISTVPALFQFLLIQETGLC